MSNTISAAATVVLVRNIDKMFEVLMLRRSKDLQFAGGSWVFPGGRIDAADYDSQPEDGLGAARRAAVRETREEAGLTVDAGQLQYFAHWTAPPEVPKRFSTWFFICKVDEIDDVVVDGGEIVQHRWLKPQEALDAHRAKTFELTPPTFVTLWELSGCESADDALAMYRNRTVPEYLPHVCQSERGLCMLYPGDIGYDNKDAQRHGARHRILLADGVWHYERRF